MKKLTFILGLLALISHFMPSESQRDPRQLYPPDQLPPPQPYRPRRGPPCFPPLYGLIRNPLPPPFHFGPGRVPLQPFPLGPPPFPGYPNPPFQLGPYRPRPIRGPILPCPRFPVYPTIYLTSSNPEPQIKTTTTATIITPTPTTTAAAYTDTSTEPTTTAASSTKPTTPTSAAMTPTAPTEDATQIITHPPGTLLLSATLPVTTPYPTTASSTTSQSLWQKFLSIFG
uniref:Opiorphin prepropeptide n=1 Tax=Prolemur simus TaxID=1328070 RepID=A0A8C8ZPM7_PROSS